MCGIVAGVTRVWPSEGAKMDGKEAVARELSRRLTHRGPDESGVHVGEGYWMGHTRLSIVGPEDGHQPIVSPDGKYALVCNGEIYNHAQLREGLSGSPAFQTKSDSEIVTHLYHELGVGAADKLVGMYAFVLVVDGGAEVFAARDKVGIKPLYMGTSHDDGEIMFASELKAIVDRCHTVELVPPGHYWTRATGLVKFYNPEWDVENYQPPKYSTPEQCREALEKAVVDRLMTDVEIGVLLSGGLDSSIVTALTAKHMHDLHNGQRVLKSFAVGQEGSPDLVAARSVAKSLGTDHYECKFTPEMAFQELDNIIYHMETYEPELIRSSIPNYFLAKTAAQHVKTVITGEGADEIWSGYLYYHDCTDARLLQEENRRILKAVQFVNLQRADRMCMAHALEARVPFFDVQNIAVAMAVDPKEKLINKERCEKWMLRKMFEDIVPKEVVWRTKAMQCEGVGMTWVNTLQSYLNSRVSDEDFAKRAETFPSNTPHTKEEFYYRRVFERHFPGCEKFVHVWEGGCRAAGAPWKVDAYTREGLRDVSRLKIGHGLADSVNI